MRFGRLFWRLFVGNAVLMTVVLTAFIWLIVNQIEQFHLSELTTTLRSQAQTLDHFAEGRMDAAHAGELNQLAHRIAATDPTNLRITFIAADGTVLGDSDSNPAGMEPHGHRPEFEQALRDGWGEDIRLSQTLDKQMKYVAVRTGSPDAPTGVVRVAVALRAIGQHAENMRRLVWILGGAAFTSCILLALGLARLWSKPIRRITRTARSLSRGDLNARLRVSGRDELAELARSLNEMRDNLVQHLETIDRQRRMLQSLLAQLHEGVIVTRADGLIALMNPAAARLLGIAEPADQLIGRPLETCVTPHRLQKLLTAGDDVGDGSIHEVQIKVQGENSRVSVLARACGIVLDMGSATAPSGQVTTGRLLVLTDVTPLAKMIQVKADFAANASHELRTPLSLIRAAVETLTSIDPIEDAASMGRFTEIIDRNSARMEALVQDLLDLSRLESATAPFEAGEIRLPEFTADLHDRYHDRIESKHVHWELELEPNLDCLKVNAHLLRLVLDNLLDNAIKFTPSDGKIRVTAHPQIDADRRWMRIEVTDTGCGIPQDEQERVFERFYQVERSRSGTDRGTGLGLSIVRHAVSALGGSVRLRSVPGQGTTVTVLVPFPVLDPCVAS